MTVWDTAMNWNRKHEAWRKLRGKKRVSFLKYWLWGPMTSRWKIPRKQLEIKRRRYRFWSHIYIDSSWNHFGTTKGNIRLFYKKGKDIVRSRCFPSILHLTKLGWVYFQKLKEIRALSNVTELLSSFKNINCNPIFIYISRL